MLISAWTILALLAPSVLGGQVPVVGGVLGGVPSTKLASFKQAATSANTTPGKLRIVENSGICGLFDLLAFLSVLWELKYLSSLETTSGVYQASGYGDLTSTESLWFWFFAARKNPDTAPLALWFNGGVSHPTSYILNFL